MNFPDKIQSKILPVDKLVASIADTRRSGKTVAFTNGCFDILHRGHIHYLSEASGYGDIFIIGLNSDDSIKRIKGAGRPIQDEASRSVLLASLFFVDFVVIFDEDTPAELIRAIQPDVLLKGGDYQAENIVGYDTVNNSGGRVVIIPFVTGYSTSNIIKRILKTGSN